MSHKPLWSLPKGKTSTSLSWVRPVENEQSPSKIYATPHACTMGSVFLILSPESTLLENHSPPEARLASKHWLLPFSEVRLVLCMQVVGKVRELCRRWCQAVQLAASARLSKCVPASHASSYAPSVSLLAHSKIPPNIVTSPLFYIGVIACVSRSNEGKDLFCASIYY